MSPKKQSRWILGVFTAAFLQCAAVCYGGEDSPPTSGSDGWFCITSVFYVIVVIVLIKRVTDHHKRRMDAEGLYGFAKASLKKLEQEYDELEELYNTSKAEIKAEKIALAKLRQDLERRETALAVAAKPAVTQAVATAKELHHRSIVIQQQQFFGSDEGGGLYIRWVLDPGDRTRQKGLRGVVINFEIHQVRPDPPTLVVFRNKRQIKRCTTFKGTVQSTLRPGYAYLFVFRLFDGNREVPGTPFFTIQNPPADFTSAQSETPPKRLSKAKRRRTAEEMRKAEYETIRMIEKDPVKQKERMAAVDQEIVDKFGEAE